ncbi:MAG: ATP synthase subunit b, sodium ion specific [Firmicutes bacterium ADurb.Bin354]|nr:MAG: ATP synthase subunit b, sodium ion specific [Firmicutes bacterium ADurb.Bin354]SCY15349.1 F-type H+-transporting ATPase subunit b [Lachnospiraceae bacterium XPB1003]
MNTAAINMLLSSADGGETMTRLFGLDLQLLFDSGLTLLAVFTLFLVLSYNLFNPARKVLQGRTERIQSDIESAKKDKEDAEQLKKEYEAKLSDAENEVERILAEARKRALANEDKIVSDAKKEASAIIERANNEAELEKKRVKDEVKQEMVNIASLMAAKVVAKNIDTSVQDELVEDTLKEIGDDTWRS